MSEIRFETPEESAKWNDFYVELDALQSEGWPEYGIHNGQAVWQRDN